MVPCSLKLPQFHVSLARDMHATYIVSLHTELIVSIRTYAISRKARWVLYLLSTMFVMCTIVEFLGNVWMRVRKCRLLTSPAFLC